MQSVRHELIRQQSKYRFLYSVVLLIQIILQCIPSELVRMFLYWTDSCISSHLQIRNR